MTSLELARLFRRSNILFFFLFVYVLLTPIGRFIDHTSHTTNASIFYEGFVHSISLFSMLLMAIFIVNNIGNEFNEGSYRKMLVVGLEKKEYFAGKLILVVIIAFLVTVCCSALYFLLGLLVVEGSILDLLIGLSFCGVLDQFFGLIFIGLFGLFFIMVFRSRTIGLVFFPFWFFTEFFAYLLSKTNKNLIIADYLPGVLGWRLHNSRFDNDLQILMVIIFTTIFITAAWYGLALREEK